jgi:two-component system, sensor histidine kinase RpfC
MSGARLPNAVPPHSDGSSPGLPDSGSPQSGLPKFGAASRNAREMALNRMVFGLGIGIYVIATSPSLGELVGLGCYVLFSILLLAWLLLRPGRYEKTAIGCALVADLGIITVGMHLDGPGNAAFFPLYLWTILGNGFRLGLTALMVAMAMACAGFAAVIVTTPFWRNQPALSASLLLSLLVLPLYSSTLIRKLSRARLEAEKASHAKSMFLAAISHELRTPLNAILGSVSLIEDTPLDEDQRSLFNAMRTGTRALLSLIGGILDFSRLEAGRMPVSSEAIDLPAFLVEIRDLVGVEAHAKGLQLSIHVAAEVPLEIVADRKHLLEVLINLSANAVKFTQIGGVCVSVETLPAEAGKPPRLRFGVTDTGIGIAEEAVGRIFEAFSQADDSILDRFGGTGLGLAISRQLVMLMGGEIGVDSRPGRGSTFWFTLDLVAAAPGTLPVAATSPDSPGRVALLCDDPALGEQIEAALLRNGLAVRRAASVTEVIVPAENAESAGRRSGEVLVLYRRDPGGDLAADCALLGKLDPRAAIPRILLSQGAEPAIPSAMLRRHFITVLQTPPDDVALERACRLALAATTRPSPPYSRETAAADTAGRPLRVLVADDNETNRRVVRMILERAGHHVELSEDGMQAMDAIESASFDLVLMDVNMPRMNGLEATRLLRLAMPATPRLPILALTADATGETEQKCLDAGMDGFIVKPIAPARLLAAVKAQADLQPVPQDEGAVTRIATHPRFAATVPALDQTVLDELRTLGGDSFVEELLDGFVADAHDLVERIETALEAGDMTAFRFELHGLRSAASNIGATALREATSGRDITQATLSVAGRTLMRRLRHELACLDRARESAGRMHGTASG